MGLHMYCIVPAAHRRAAAQSGVAGAAVRTIEAGDIAAVVSEHESRPEAGLETIRAHNAVVAAAMDDIVTPVPVRFGQWLADDAAVRAALGEGSDRWRAMLAQLAGCVEFGIRIFDPSAPEPAEGSRARTGREYMAALATRVAGPAARQADAVGALRAELSGHYAGERVEPLRTRHGVASVAYLVHRPAIDAYLTAVERVRIRMPALRYLSTGPWPPYSFVD